jgi:lysosomal acid lipase/cholesteryl ester hydrolase
VGSIDVPIAISSGSHDPLSDPADVELLIPKLKNLVYNRKLEEFNHMDFVTGLDASDALYPDIVKLSKKYSNLV